MRDKGDFTYWGTDLVTAQVEYGLAEAEYLQAVEK
jgi:hypothetical protein